MNRLPKEIDWKKRCKHSKILRKKEKQLYFKYRESLRNDYQGRIKELESQLKKKEEDDTRLKWAITLHEQTLAVSDFASAQTKVKVLLDLGFWFLELKTRE